MIGATKPNPTTPRLTAVAARDLVCDYRAIGRGERSSHIATRLEDGGLRITGRPAPNVVLHNDVDGLRFDAGERSVLVAFSVTGEFSRILFRMLGDGRVLREFVIRRDQQGEKVFQVTSSAAATCTVDFNIVGDDLDVLISDIVFFAAPDEALEAVGSGDANAMPRTTAANQARKRLSQRTRSLKL